MKDLPMPPRVHFSTLTLALLASLSAQAAPLAPDAGQTSRELEKHFVPVLPDSAAPLRIEGENRLRGADDQGLRIPVKAIRITGNSVIATAELAALVADLSGDRSLAELDAGAARITARYRQAGYAVARAFLPAQDIIDGVVDIRVLEGRLDQRQLVNRSLLSDRRADDHLEVLENGAVLNERKIDRSLLLLGDTPGVAASRATLQPGTSVGSSELIVELDPDRRYSGSVELDNFGNRYTGEYRLGGTLNINSPLGIGDQITLRALASDQELAYGRLAYSLPVGADGLRLGAAYAETRYHLAKEFDALNGTGTARSASLFATYPLLRSRNSNLYTTLSFEDKQLDDHTATPQSSLDKHLQLVAFGLSGNHRDGLAGGGISAFDLSLTGGQLDMDDASRSIDASTARSNGSFSRLNYTVNRLQRITDTDSLSFLLTGQQAGKNLASSEKFILGGANGVRAFPQGEGSGDQGWLVNLEIRHGFTAKTQGIIFYDAGAVDINRNRYAAGSNTRQLSGAGLGANADFSAVQLKAYVAWRTSGGQADTIPASADRKPALWVQIGSQF